MVAGLATVIAASPVLFTAIRWAGAAYLIVLGLRALRGTGRPGVAADGADGGGAGRAFRRGLLTNLLNPKMILFSVAFLPQFVRPDAGPVAAQLVLLGALFVAVQLTVDPGSRRGPPGGSPAAGATAAGRGGSTGSALSPSSRSVSGWPPAEARPGPPTSARSGPS